MGGTLNTMLTENVVSGPYFCIDTYIMYPTYYLTQVLRYPRI